MGEEGATCINKGTGLEEVTCVQGANVLHDLFRHHRDKSSIAKGGRKGI